METCSRHLLPSPKVKNASVVAAPIVLRARLMIAENGQRQCACHESLEVGLGFYRRVPLYSLRSGPHGSAEIGGISGTNALTMSHMYSLFIYIYVCVCSYTNHGMTCVRSIRSWSPAIQSLCDVVWMRGPALRKACYALVAVWWASEHEI